ncbi:MAG: hypothetical protein Q8O52_08630 [Sulfuritalea sp.]|nr:hypothetical protein [Sulfuritalea sp.]
MQANASHQTKLAAALAIPPTMAAPMAAPVAGYVTIKQAAELRPAFTPAAFRDLKFKAHDRKNSRGDTIKGNGTGPAGVWVQIGAKVLLDLCAFDRWIESHKVVALK